MYVHPFILGVFMTVFVLFALILVAAYISYRNDKKKQNKFFDNKKQVIKLKLAKVANNEKLNPREIQKQYANKVEESLAKEGVIFFNEENLDIDMDFMKLPREITEVSGKDLGEYLNAFTQQKLYLRTLLGRTEVELDEASKEYYEKAHPLYKKYSSEKLSEKAKDRMVNADPNVSKFYNIFVEVKRRCTLISQSIENIEDAIFLISREISRRITDYENESRNMSVQGK